MFYDDYDWNNPSEETCDFLDFSDCRVRDCMSDIIEYAGEEYASEVISECEMRTCYDNCASVMNYAECSATYVNVDGDKIN